VTVIAIHSAEPVIFGVVEIVWKDGFAGIVDLRPILAKVRCSTSFGSILPALTISSWRITVTAI
jgi:hypothetical protein